LHVFLNPQTEVLVFPYIDLMIADKSNNLPSSHHHHCSLVSKCDTLITHFLLFGLMFLLSTGCRNRKVSSYLEWQFFVFVVNDTTSLLVPFFFFRWSNYWLFSTI